MECNRSIFSYLYESTIIEQQITHHVLNKEYLKLKGEEAVNEAFNFKDKIAKFGKFIRKIWGAIVTFITKTFPGWVKTAVDKILEVLKIKKDPVTVDLNKVEEGTDAETKDKIVSEINKANKANGKILSGNYHVGEAPTINNEKNEDKSEENDNKKEVVAAEKEVQQACENLENIAKQDGVSPEVKSEIQNAVSAVKQRKYVVATKSPRFKFEGVEGPFFIEYKEMKAYHGAFYDALISLDNIRSEYMNNIEDNLNRSQGIFDKEDYTDDFDPEKEQEKYKKYSNTDLRLLERRKKTTFKELFEFWVKKGGYLPYEDCKKVGIVKLSTNNINIFKDHIKDCENFQWLKHIFRDKSIIESLLKTIERSDLSYIPEKTVSAAVTYINDTLKEYTIGINAMEKYTWLLSSQMTTFLACGKPYGPEIVGDKPRGLK